MKTSKFKIRKGLIKVTDNAVLTIDQVAEKLQVSPTWLYKKAKTGLIPHTRIGRMLRFRQKDIDKWLDSHGVKETKAKA